MKVGESYDPRKLWDREIPDWLRKRRHFCPGAKLCFGYLTHYAGQDGPELEALGEALGVNKRQAAGYVMLLKATGLLETERLGPGKGCRYTFLWHPWAEGLQLQDTATVAVELQDTASQEPIELQDTATVGLEVQFTATVGEEAPTERANEPVPPPPRTPPLPRDSVKLKLDAAPAGAAVASALEPAEPPKKERRQSAGQQAFQVAVEHVVKHYCARFAEVYPKGSAPTVDDGGRSQVKIALQAVAKADGLDWLAAESATIRLIDRFLADQKTPFVVNNAHSLRCFAGQVHRLRQEAAKAAAGAEEIAAAVRLNGNAQARDLCRSAVMQAAQKRDTAAADDAAAAYGETLLALGWAAPAAAAEVRRTCEEATREAKAARRDWRAQAPEVRS